MAVGLRLPQLSLYLPEASLDSIASCDPNRLNRQICVGFGEIIHLGDRKRLVERHHSHGSAPRRFSYFGVAGVAAILICRFVDLVGKARDVGFEPGFGDFDGLAARQRFQRVRQVFGARHLCAVDKHRNDGNSSREPRFDPNVYEISVGLA